MKFISHLEGFLLLAKQQGLREEKRCVVSKASRHDLALFGCLLAHDYIKTCGCLPRKGLIFYARHKTESGRLKITLCAKRPHYFLSDDKY